MVGALSATTPLLIEVVNVPENMPVPVPLGPVVIAITAAETFALALAITTSFTEKAVLLIIVEQRRRLR